MPLTKALKPRSRKIVDVVLGRNLPGPDRRPWFVVLGGINGAGKTTLAARLASHADLLDATFLNPDAVTAEALASDPTLTQGTAEFLGLRTVREELGRLLQARKSIVTETVFASRAYMRLIKQAKADGYFVWLLFVGVPTIEDSIARVARGGHNVPEADIRRRWPLAHQNLAHAVALADKVTVYANIGYANAPFVVASASDGKVTLLDRDALPAVTAVLAPLC